MKKGSKRKRRLAFRRKCLLLWARRAGEGRLSSYLAGASGSEDRLFLLGPSVEALARRGHRENTSGSRLDARRNWLGTQ